MKDLQVRFGVVLLVIISVVSFMIGHSLRPVMDARNGSGAVAGVSNSVAAPSYDEGGRKPRI